uniref:Uncharacterized protein n=1 Tax=Anguilla anguilla TaxID=7936 RepID=A0A0E9V3Y8_ANGAN
MEEKMLFYSVFFLICLDVCAAAAVPARCKGR